MSPVSRLLNHTLAMEKSTSLGLIAGLVLIYGAIFLGDGWETFFAPDALLLVVGGTAASLMVSFSMQELKQVPQGVKDFFRFEPPALEGYIEEFSELSRVARREGLLAVDRRLGDLEDAFMSFGLEMAIDGVEEEEIRDLLRERVASEMQQRQLLTRFFTNAGTFAPAFGMVGTLIGLIQMLQNLTDPTQIGSGMAVALITTFYGALLANLIFLPFVTKLKTQGQNLLKARQMVLVGVLAIVRGESPSMMEKRLQIFLTDGGSEGDRAARAAPLSRAA